MTAIFRQAIGSRATSTVKALRAARWARCLAATVMVASVVAVTHASAAARTGGFSDVTGGVHKPAIDALAALGAFEGTLCGDDTFCPDEPLKRSTMAVWLIRTVEDQDPPPVRESRFADVAADESWAPHTERLAELEITLGCMTDPLRYCPDRTVTRAEMATFLVRAFDLESAEPAGFADTQGNFHAPNIDALAAAGVTAGCDADPPRYCPTRPVNRAEMATFLARALGVVPLPEPSPNLETQPTTAVLYSFVTTRGSRSNIWIARLDGTGLIRLIADGRIDGYFPLDGWGEFGNPSPDGKRIAYTVTRGDDAGIWVEDADGSNPVRLPGASSFAGWSLDGKHLAWSPDSKHLAYTIEYRDDAGNRDEQLWVARADGTHPVMFSSNSYAAHDGSSRGSLMGWSPDGTRLAYTISHEYEARSGERPDGLIGWYENELWVAEADGTGQVRLVRHTGSVHPFYYEGSAGWSPDSKHLAYTISRQEAAGNWVNGELWVAEADGAGQVKLAEVRSRPGNRPDRYWPQRWSPDGKHLAYTVEFERFPAVWVAEADGSNPVRFSNYGRIEGWSPNGKQLAYTKFSPSYGRDEAGIWVADADGSNPFKLEGAANFTAQGQEWSPDGKRLAYEGRRGGREELWSTDLWVAGTDGSSPTRLTTNGGWYQSWSPDGKFSYYTSIEGNETNRPLWVAGADGSNPVRLTASSGNVNGFLFNGQHVVYTEGGGDGAGIWVAETDGSNPVRIIANGADPGLSPDGTHVAYRLRDEEGHAHVWVAEADGSNPVQVAEFGVWSAFDEWSPDSRYLLLTAYDQENKPTEWVVAADGSNPIKLTHGSFRDLSVFWLTG